MKAQEKYYFSKEADDWFDRNSPVINAGEDEQRTIRLEKKRERIAAAIRQCGIAPRRMLEIGGSNGYDLAALQQEFGCEAFVVEPSRRAVEDGAKRFPNINIRQGVASDLKCFADGEFDFVLIKGVFCWIGREELLQSVAEMDRVLADQGHLMLIDYYVETPLMNRNVHVREQEIYCFKMDHAAIFLAGKTYRTVYNEIYPDPHDEYRGENRVVRSILKKDYYANYLKSS